MLWSFVRFWCLIDRLLHAMFRSILHDVTVCRSIRVVWGMVMLLMLQKLGLQVTVAESLGYENLSMLESRKLKVGEERKRDFLPFKTGGKCVYELVGLKADHGYEVKISYPASIPAKFSLYVIQEQAEKSSRQRRKLLNTEKLIFYVNKESFLQGIDNKFQLRVLVAVEPAGVLASAHLQEQAYVLFNIVCEELLLGIPLQAYWVGLLALFAVSASIIASLKLPLIFKSMELAMMKSSKQIS